jgi:hypothetical protein
MSAADQRFAKMRIKDLHDLSVYFGKSWGSESSEAKLCATGTVSNQAKV